MKELIYVIEDYDSGAMTGYRSKQDALDAMLKYYLDSGFGNMYNFIVKAANEGKVDEVCRLLDNIKEDFQNMLGEGHYIDGLISMREVEIVN